MLLGAATGWLVRWLAAIVGMMARHRQTRPTFQSPFLAARAPQLPVHSNTTYTTSPPCPACQTDNRLEITTKRTILENEQMSGELQYQSRQVGCHSTSPARQAS